MNLGERLLRSMKRAALTQREVAKRSGLHVTTVNKLMNEETKEAAFDTVDRVRRAIGVSWSELFDEPSLRLSHEHADLAGKFSIFLETLLENDLAQKEIGASRSLHPSSPTTFLRETPVMSRPEDEVENLPNEIIPEDFLRLHARRAFKVRTDAMIGIGILDRSIIYLYPTQNEPAADGRVVVCRLNGVLYLKVLDLRGNTRTLRSENPRYAPIVVKAGEHFSLIGIVVQLPRE